MLYWAIIRFNFARFITYPLELVAVMVRRVIEIGFFILLWVVIARSSNGAISTQALPAYFLISSSVNVFTNTTQMRLAARINSVIRNGTLSNYLIKPLPGVGFLLAESIGQSGPSYLFALFTLVLGILLSPHQTAASLLLFPVYLVIAFAISFSINLLLGTLSLHFVEARSYHHSAAHLIRILAGIMVPLTFFPDWLRKIADLTPFPATVFGPTTLLSHPDTVASQLPAMLYGGVWAVGLLLVSTLLWNRSLRAYDAVGI